MYVTFSLLFSFAAALFALLPSPDQTVKYLETCSDYFDRLSLYVNTESAICARLSCGGVIEMCRAVAEGQIRNGFAIVRFAFSPPNFSRAWS